MIEETSELVEEDKAHEELLDKEAGIREKVDERGNKWRKVYFGGGPHFRNSLIRRPRLLRGCLYLP